MNAQGTQEWLQDRAGRLTASSIADMLAKVKTGESASRANLRARLVAERLTGTPSESYTNSAMQWGIEHEPIARATYEVRACLEVEQVGFVAHPSIAWAGASPDGLVGDGGLVEIKCPNTATHIEYLLSASVPAKYQPQMLWQMECAGRAWCDFVSFDPRLPAPLDLFVARFYRDEARLSEIRSEAVRFLDEVADTVDRLQKIVAESAQ